MTVDTRFRAYQLGQKGASFSYATNDTFTLIEARMTDTSKQSILNELSLFRKPRIDVLHITSWDKDHCNISELIEILYQLQPLIIECPGYPPRTNTGHACLDIIDKYEQFMRSQAGMEFKEAVCVMPNYIQSLRLTDYVGYNNVFCWPHHIDYNTSNNNSTVKIFGVGAFNVASLGDVESVNIASPLFANEVDIMTLAHHGADCENNSKEFFETTKPTAVICGSNYGNEYDHPKPVVRQRLRDLNIPLYTTKTGDIIIESVKEHPAIFTVYNLCSNSLKVSSVMSREIKKYRNATNLYRPSFA